MSDYARIFSERNNVNVAQPLPGRESEMDMNRGGGYAFHLSPKQQVERFLILGSPSTYYASQREMTLENAGVILDYIKDGHGVDLVHLIEDVNSVRYVDNYRYPARASRKGPSLFALALAREYGDESTRQAVYRAIRGRSVVSTLRQMYEFLHDIYMIRGKGKMSIGGSGFKRAIQYWFNSDTRRTAYQLVKYRSGSYRKSNGRPHTITAKDVLRMAHVEPQNDAEDALYEWAVSDNGYEHIKGYDRVNGVDEALQYVWAFEEAQATDNPKRIVELIHKYGLTWEAIPNTWFSDNSKERVGITRALLGLDALGSTPELDNNGNPRWSMPMTALLRWLPRLSAYHALPSVGTNDALQFAIDKITDSEALVNARIHPVAVVNALFGYKNGHNRNIAWPVNSALVNALEVAFYKSFGTVPVTNKRYHYAFDASASMSWGNVVGLPNLMPMQASAIMGMALVRREPHYVTTAFSDGMLEFDLYAGDSLQAAIQRIETLNWGVTNIGASIEWMIKNRVEIDTVVIFTDNEVNRGRHVQSLLNEYRTQSGINTRLVVVGMTATDFTIGDPKDPGILNVVGFDASAPQAIADFSTGDM